MMRSSNAQSFLAGVVCSAALVYLFLKIQDSGKKKNNNDTCTNADERRRIEDTAPRTNRDKIKGDPAPGEEEENVVESKGRGVDPPGSSSTEEVTEDIIEVTEDLITPEEDEEDNAPGDPPDILAEEAEVKVSLDRTERPTSSTTAHKTTEDVQDEKKEPTPSESFEEMARELEEKEAWEGSRKMSRNAAATLENTEAGGSLPLKTTITSMEIAENDFISEGDCLSIMSTFAERYADEKVQQELKQAAMGQNFIFNKEYIVRSKEILSPLQRDVLEKYGYFENGQLDEENDDPEGSDGKAKLEVDGDSESFEESLDDLLLIGVGLRKESSNRLYALALYSGKDTKDKVISDMSSRGSGSIAALDRALKSSIRTTFLLRILETDANVQEMSVEFQRLVSCHTKDNFLFAQCSSLMYKAGEIMEKEYVFSAGTTFKLECDHVGVKFSVDGNEIGTFSGFTEVFYNAFLNHKTIGPSLHRSVIENCCDTAAKVKQVADAMAHDHAFRKLQKDVRYWAKKNKAISEKMVLCRKLTSIPTERQQ
mmetsp:Transcript_46350/g.97387  ORF Transcript_46350/g.97387 Transcript_46350/m.97387 type:complete len:539 (+) Transcript_46350:41-1657(+)